MHYLERELFELLRTDDEALRFITEVVLDGLWYWDLEDPEHEWMDENFWRTLGYEPAEKKHLASEWREIINPSDLRVATVNAERHIADPDHLYDQLVRYRHGETGEDVWIQCFGRATRDENGRAIRLLGAHKDVTQLMRIRERMQEALNG